ncbi:DUF6090 family protein [Winogradskyella sp. MIT101101]|uniref:DUF6090 family protein n=1 Tax=Winogradskyella sp. MIT101101 TaxID=3098297 RepID=UPI00399B5622
MIKFFRHIRQSMIKQNKTKKYLLYAIGEIILVVIGILIALQINNWNEDRKLASLEKAILIDLKQDLVITRNIMDDDLNQNKLKVEQLESMIYNIDNKIAYTKDMDTLFRALNAWASPYMVMTTYEIFKAKGVETIQNKEIKEKTITLYESTFPLLKDDYDRAEWALMESVTNPFIVKYFAYNTSSDKSVLTPNSYDELLENKEFRNLTTFVKHLRMVGLKTYSNTIDDIEELINLINSEIK